VAALSLEYAQRARREAERLRLESNVLRLVVRRQRRTTNARLAGARAATNRARAHGATPLPSPWSELHWVNVGRSLDRTLVPLD
jgi:hypothetical protein